MDQHMFRAAEVAKILGLSRRTVVKLVASRELEGTRLGGLTLVRRSAVERLLGKSLTAPRTTTGEGP